jgi:hypothetical protein
MFSDDGGGWCVRDRRRLWKWCSRFQRLASRLGCGWKNASFLSLFYKIWNGEAATRPHRSSVPRVEPFQSRVLAPGPCGGRVLLTSNPEQEVPETVRPSRPEHLLAHIPPSRKGACSSFRWGGYAGLQPWALKRAGLDAGMPESVKRGWTAAQLTGFGRERLFIKGESSLRPIEWEI